MPRTGEEINGFVVIKYHICSPNFYVNTNQLGNCSVADPGCFSQIPDPNFLFPVSRIQGQKDSGSRIRIRENLSIFNLKIVSKVSEITNRDIHPGSGSCFLPIPDPGSRGQKRHWIPDRSPDPGSGSATLGKSYRIFFCWLEGSYSFRSHLFAFVGFLLFFNDDLTGYSSPRLFPSY